MGPERRDMRTMSGQAQAGTEATRAAAAAWVVRLQAPDAGEPEWLAFEAWLDSDPGTRPAYDAAMTVWLAADGLDLEEIGGTERTGRRLRGDRHFRVMAALGLGGLGAAALAMLAVATHPSWTRPAGRPAAPAARAYATGPGERRAIRLADGTELDLSGGSRISVSLDASARRVTMTSGEVAFRVVHDARRPFVVAIADQQVRDLGTEFDIRRAGPEIKVTVRQGEVEVAAVGGAGGAPLALRAGRQWVHDEDTGVSSVHAVAPDDVFAWKEGRLIYRDQPLKAVVDDLNRYFPHAVRIEGDRVAELRFTGVITVDGEAATIRRLTALLPIEATEVDGATVLKARPEHR